MIRDQSHVLVDTMIIIEAHRVGCWRALLGHYRLDTVQRCMEECATGNQRQRNPVSIDTRALQADLSPKSVGPKAIAQFTLQYAGAVDLHAGEKDLLTYAFTLESGSYFICSSDRACLRAGLSLGILDQFVSLEELVVGTGERMQLKEQFSKKWLEGVRTQLRLES
jgi:hypothetical protein